MAPYVVFSKQSNVNWIPSSNWTGPSAVLYQSFDSSEGVILMEKTEPAAMNCVLLVSGKVKYIRFVFRTIRVKSKTAIKLN